MCLKPEVSLDSSLCIAPHERTTEFSWPYLPNRSPPPFSHFHLQSFILSQLSSFAWSTAVFSNLFLPTLLASYNISDCMFPCLESTYLLIPIRRKIPKFLTVANKVVLYFQLKYLPLPPSLPLSFPSLQPCRAILFRQTLVPTGMLFPDSAPLAPSALLGLDWNISPSELLLITKNNSHANLYHIIMLQNFQIVSYPCKINHVLVLRVFLFIRLARI